ncbi:MAG: 16S rRNA (cytosine(967)-C(5))-methyltransferase RsmB [Erysipelotrichales bacterium]
MNKSMRYCAYEIVKEVRYNGGYSNLLLKNNINHLNDSDKKLVTNIVYGTLKNYELLQYQLNQVEFKKMNHAQEVIILISLYQYHFLDRIPMYAIVNEAVNLTKEALSHFDSKFINVILKQLLEKDLMYSKSDDKFLDLSINYSMPVWLIKMINKQYGYDFLIEYLKDNMNKSDLYIRYNTLSDKRYLLKDDVYELIDNNTYNLIGNDTSYLELYKEGILSIQDYSSQQVAQFLNALPNSSVLDMCAAPGNKTSAIAELMNNEGSIDAFDIYQHKIELINNQANRLGINIIKAREYNATKISEIYDEGTFDYILCDAPCTGLGVIKRKPEIKYHDPSVMDELIKVQEQLLEEAYLLLKKGGVLVYSTCTINKKENEKQIQSFLNKYDDIKLIEERYVYQMENDCDSFYMAKVTKK